MKDLIQTIGGILIVLLCPLFIGLIWLDRDIMWKLIITDVILIFFLMIVESNMD